VRGDGFDAVVTRLINVRYIASGKCHAERIGKSKEASETQHARFVQSELLSIAISHPIVWPVTSPTSRHARTFLLRKIVATQRGAHRFEDQAAPFNRELENC
jgi:hypothetical protein